MPRSLKGTTSVLALRVGNASTDISMLAVLRELTPFNCPILPTLLNMPPASPPQADALLRAETGFRKASPLEKCFYLSLSARALASMTHVVILRHNLNPDQVHAPLPLLVQDDVKHRCDNVCPWCGICCTRLLWFETVRVGSFRPGLMPRMTLMKLLHQLHKLLHLFRPQVVAEAGLCSYMAPSALGSLHYLVLWWTCCVNCFRFRRLTAEHCGKSVMYTHCCILPSVL